MTSLRPVRSFTLSTSFFTRHRWLILATLFSLTIALTLVRYAKESQAQTPITNPIAVVSVAAASYELFAIAPDSIVAAFGTKLATATAVGNDTDPNTPGIQLPTSLAGTTVEVGGKPAGLFFVSAGQINYVIPTGTAAGTIPVIVKAGDGTISNGTVEVSQVAPSIFTANADGGGVPAAYLVRVKANGQQIDEPLSERDPVTQRLIPKSFDLGPDGELIVLVLFASGVRNAPDPNNDGNANENVRVTIGGVELRPDYAGRQPGFVGLDQINVIIPRALIGRGKINLSLTGIGVPSSNLTQIEVSSRPGNAPPSVTGFSVNSALVGQPLNITGSGFAANSSDNFVRIGGVEARLLSASSSQLSVVVPFGAETGVVTVRTPQGEGKSNGALPVRTSVSGFVETTDRKPMSGIKVRVSGTNITATSGNDGLFVLPDLAAGPLLIEVDGPSLNTAPPFPKVTLKQSVAANRDNPFARPIALQQATGTTFAVGTGSSNISAEANETDVAEGRIESSNVVFDLPDNTAALFPDGTTSGLLTLTVVANSRTPVNLPPGTFSSSIVQLTPFGVKLTPGGKLTFPNPENIPAGTAATLFRYDPNEGGFVKSGQAFVSSDGQRIETAANAITETSYYFVSIVRPTTTVIGRVVDSDGTTPVRGALVRTKGQEAFTDGNGGFILRNVPIGTNGSGVGGALVIDASFVRPNGRIDRVQLGLLITDPGKTIVTPDIVLPAETINRPPVLLAASNAVVNAAQTLTVDFTASDPDPNQTVNVALSGNATFATLTNLGNGLYRLTLAPGANQAGSFTATLTATDSQNATTTQNVAITVTAYPDLAISMTDSPDPATINAGQNITYTINVTNNGPVAATGVTVTDTLPAGATLVSATPSAGNCANALGVVTCNLGNLAVNANATISLVVTPALTGGNAGCATIPSGQVAWFRAEGNASDAQSGIIAALQNGATFATGIVGQAFSFDGVDDRVRVPAAASMNVGAGDGFTFTAWINPSDLNLNHAQGIVVFNGTAIYLAGGTPGALFATLCYQGQSGFQCTGAMGSPGGTVKTNKFQHVAFTYDKTTGTGRLYHDGLLVASRVWGSFTAATTSDIGIGNFLSTATADPFKGLIDEPDIYNRALTATEIQAIFNAGSAGKCFSCAPTPSGQVSWFRAEGNANDAQGSNNGTLQNGATFATGKVGQAFKLDGIDDQVRIPASSSLDVGTGNGFSYMAWINPENATIFAPIFDSNGITLYLDGNTPGALVGTICYQTGNGRACTGSALISPGNTIVSNTYQQVAFTYDKTNGNARLYRDGILVTSTTLGPFTALTNSDLVIGGTTSARFKGLIDEADVYNRALTAAEISAIFNAGSEGKCISCAPTPSGQIAWFRAEGNTNDAQGSNNGTPQGALTYSAGKVGQAFSFSGTDSAVASSTALGNFGTSDYAIDFWLRTSTTRREGILSKRSACTAGSFFDVRIINGQIRAELNGGGNVTSTALVNDGVFHHIVVQRAGTAMQIYIDGVLNNTTTGSIVDINNTALFRMGDSICTATDGTQPLTGLLDEVSLINRALTAAEIQTIFNAGSSGKCVKAGCDTPGFNPVTSLTVGTSPQSVTTGDFNADGKTDLAVANSNSNNVSILLGTGAGSFGAPANFAVGVNPIFVVSGDFNGDRKTDLVTANFGGGNVSLLLGDGAGSFGTATNFAVGSIPRSIAVGDFNNDGKADLAVANSSSFNVSILLGTGTGSFAPASNLSITDSPFSVASKDFNGDGNLDLAVANLNKVSILLGTGTGSFGTPTSFAVGANPYSIAIGDLNGDGKNDLAVVNLSSDNVSILLGTGTGNFSAATNFATGSNPYAAALGDFNSDGKLDIIAANHGGNTISILTGNGAGSFSAAINFGVGINPRSVTTGDFNGDGKADLATANLLSSSVSVLLNSCTGAVPNVIINGASVSSSVPDANPFNNQITVKTVVLNP